VEDRAARATAVNDLLCAHGLFSFFSCSSLIRLWGVSSAASFVAQFP
jgi:hypothetical protein